MAHPTAVSPGFAVIPDRSGVLRASSASARVAAALSQAAADTSLWSALLGGGTLNEDEVCTLSTLAQVRTVTTGQSVFHRSHTAQSLVALRTGEVALGFRTADGVFRTERIVRGPAWLDLSSAWLGEPHAMDAQALASASVIELPRAELETRLASHPDLARRLIQGLAREVQALAVNTHELMHKDAPARLAQWLLQRCEPVTDHTGQAVVRLHERKRDVASQLAITPETLSRLMRSFTRQGVIEVAGYNVRVLNRQALAQLAEA